MAGASDVSRNRNYTVFTETFSWARFRLLSGTHPTSTARVRFCEFMGKRAAPDTVAFPGNEVI
jgi:hypothetical protein